MNKLTSFNITLKELKRAVKYSKKHGDSEFKTIRFIVSKGHGLGEGFEVSKTNGKKKKSITDVDSW